jgi:hypothetical protein
MAKVSESSLLSFHATIAIIGINPYVLVPPRHLQTLFAAAGRDRGPIPLKVRVGEKEFHQNLVKYQGAWRLYLNMPMRRAAGKDVGARVRVGVAFDPAPRIEPVPRKLVRALANDSKARTTFRALSPSRRKEICRYLNALKTAASLERNIESVLRHLRGDRPPKLRALMRRKVD